MMCSEAPNPHHQKGKTRPASSLPPQSTWPKAVTASSVTTDAHTITQLSLLTSLNKQKSISTFLTGLVFC